VDRGEGSGAVSDAAPHLFDPARLSEEDEAPPPQILHSRDLADAAPGEAPDYDYNFLDYLFTEETWSVGARAYLDEPGAVHVGLPRAELARPELAAVLVYLQRRFAVIRCLEADGYRDAWVAV